MTRRSHPISALSLPRQGIGLRRAGPLLVLAGLLLIGAWAATLAAGEWRQAVAEAGWDQLLGGVSDEVLFGGPGHYPETAWPGQPGLVGVAAHNVYWLGFDQLRRGDDLLVDTRYGTFHYRVTSTRVVDAGDRTVLASAPGRRLALTTCWPLWAGELATMRLAVFAA